MSWTKKDQAKLREYQTAQMTVKEIAVKMQRPQQLIRVELEAMGYKPIEDKPKAESEFLKGKEPVKIGRKPYAKITTAVEKRVCELREQRRTTTQIATTLNISPQTVSNILQRNGYSTKRGEYHKIKLQDLQDQEETKEDKPMKAASINEEFDAAVNQMVEEAQAKENAQKMTIKDIFEDIDKRFSGAEKEPAPVATVTDSSREKEVLTNNDITEKPKCQALTGVLMIGVLEDLLRELYNEDVEITSLTADREHSEIRFALGGKVYQIEFGIYQELPTYREVKSE